MTTEDALIAAVIAAPDDDVVRKAFADYLRENGQEERADFIEVQLRIAELRAGCSCGECVGLRGGRQHTNGGCAVDRERVELPDGSSRKAFLRQRERELWEAHAAVADMLTAPFRNCLDAHIVEYAPSGTTPSSPQAIFRRGFIAEVRCTLADWCGRSNFAEVTSVSGFSLPPVEFRTTGIGPQIVKRHPVTKVVLTDREPVQGRTDEWCWFLGATSGVREVNTLPDSFRPFAISRCPRFDTARDAINWASAAAIAWAKSHPPK